LRTSGPAVKVALLPASSTSVTLRLAASTSLTLTATVMVSSTAPPATPGSTLTIRDPLAAPAAVLASGGDLDCAAGFSWATGGEDSGLFSEEQDASARANSQALAMSA
jgi:hypothetical protein